MSNSLRPHGLQHSRIICPPLSPGIYPSSCPLNWWCYLTISSSISPFSFFLQSFPASESFPLNRLFSSDGQSIGTSASASVLPVNIHRLISFRTDWFDLLEVQETLTSLFQHHNLKASVFLETDKFRIFWVGRQAETQGSLMRQLVSVNSLETDFPLLQGTSACLVSSPSIECGLPTLWRVICFTQSPLIEMLLSRFSRVRLCETP